MKKAASSYRYWYKIYSRACTLMDYLVVNIDDRFWLFRLMETIAKSEKLIWWSFYQLQMIAELKLYKVINLINLIVLLQATVLNQSCCALFVPGQWMSDVILHHDTFLQQTTKQLKFISQPCIQCNRDITEKWCIY